ncbi:MAG: Co2+/Mg2+ efflux protein ApaG [Gammaproteobacteria bacterium]|nr:Co2+/Mg2+ efflux protein ApaG [Gammaproteobacteria bacterium]
MDADEHELSDSIEIDVQTAFLPDQSDPPDNRYVFAYTITIRNAGALPAQLLTRRWLITDGNGKVQEVQGEGVVGEQPRIHPGKKHRYSSGAVLETPVGTMEGFYGMVSDDGTDFKAHIPLFRLAVPGILN